jgi:hypothetical protein
MVQRVTAGADLLGVTLMHMYQCKKFVYYYL